MAAAAACAVAVAGAMAPAALGAPTFGPSQTYDTVIQSVHEWALGPLDGDTDPDVIGAGPGSLVSMRGAAGVGFSSAFQQDLPNQGGEHGVLMADVDRDGRNDALASLQSSQGLFSVSRGLGTGAFAAPVAVKSDAYVGGALASADFNQDGDPDVAVHSDPLTSATKRLLIMQGATGATFTRTQILSQPGSVRNAGALTAGRLNGDADPDLIAVYEDLDTVRVYRGGAGSTFSAPLSYSTGPEPKEVAIGSLNGDAHPDFALIYRTGLQFYFGKADGTFTEKAFADDYQNLRSVNIADVDGDGHNDVVVSDKSRIVVLAGRSTGTFSNVLTIADSGGHNLKVADLDGDRAPDLLYGPWDIVTRRNTTPRADLAAKLATSTTATTTADLKYTLGATNAGPTTATGVILTLDLPASFTFKTAPSGCTYTAILRRVTCTVNQLASGATASRVIAVRPTAKGQFSAIARVTSARGDFNQANNARIAVTTVN